MASFADFVCETASNPGTSTTVNLLGAATGPFCTFGTRFSTGASVFYTITDGSAQSETGTGTFTTGTPNTLSRTTVLANTSGTTTRLNFTGTVYVYSVPAASKIVIRDEVWQTIGSYTASGASSLVIPLSSSFSEFQLRVRNAWTSADAKILGIQLSLDGGSTYKNTNYVWAAASVTTGGTPGDNGSTNDSIIPISPGLTNADENGWGATVDISPGGGSNTASVRTEGFGRVTGPTYLFWSAGGTYAGSVGLANYMQVTRADGGAFSGIFTLQGRP